MGYRTSEIPLLCKPLDIAEGVKVKRTYFNADGAYRAAELVTSPFYYYGAALPHPDTRSPEGLLRGFNGRMGKKLPEITIPNYFERLNKVTRSWIERRKLEPVSPEEDFDFYSWLNSRKLDTKRRQEFIDIHNDIVDMLERNDEGGIS